MPSLLAEYLAYLTDNRRLSPHSVRAYHATADRLTGILQLHWGTDVTRETLRKGSAADMRAFLADRRGDGLTHRSPARARGVRKANQPHHPEAPLERLSHVFETHHHCLNTGQPTRLRAGWQQVRCAVRSS